MRSHATDSHPPTLLLFPAQMTWNAHVVSITASQMVLLLGNAMKHVTSGAAAMWVRTECSSQSVQSTWHCFPSGNLPATVQTRMHWSVRPVWTSNLLGCHPVLKGAASRNEDQKKKKNYWWDLSCSRNEPCRLWTTVLHQESAIWILFQSDLALKRKEKSTTIVWCLEVERHFSTQRNALPVWGWSTICGLVAGWDGRKTTFSTILWQIKWIDALTWFDIQIIHFLTEMQNKSQANGNLMQK